MWTQTAGVLQWSIAALVLLAALRHGLRTRAEWRKPVPPPRAPRDLAGAAFAHACTAIETPCEAAAALAERTHDAYRGYLESVQSLEGKATSILSFVGGGVGLVSLAAGTDKVPKVTTTPLLVIAVLALVAMLYAALQVVMPRRRRAVDVEEIADLDVLLAKNGKSVLDTMVAREYVEAVRTMIPIVRSKARWLQLAHTYFAVAITVITVNAVIPAPRDSTHDIPRTTVLHCALTAHDVNCTLN